MPHPPQRSDQPTDKRCAIYTRKSSDHGLGCEFNSLEGQRAICSAYIASQRHKGWTEIAKRFDDGGVSGATLNRPSLQELLGDIERGLVDVVVIYKLDRLSRSLLDFVRLLELFSTHEVSFVCITQNFDTADSLGRLVLNVLLTFAQFERELAGDRIRDKKRLMTAKGIWPGGRPPLGYDLLRHRLVVNVPEAALVSHIYERYAALRSMKAVTKECRAAGLVSKVRITKSGARVGGRLLSIGGVRRILTNPVYVGRLRLGNESCVGLHQAIVPTQTWDEAQAIRREQLKRRLSIAPEDLFGGLAYDCFDRRMKSDRRYLKSGWVALYTSFQTDWARSNGISRLRVNAANLEGVVLGAIHDLLTDPSKLQPVLTSFGEPVAGHERGCSASRRLRQMNHGELRTALQTIVERIEVSRERVAVVIRVRDVARLLAWDGVQSFGRDGRRSAFHCLNIPWVGVARLERRLRLPITKHGPSGKLDKRLINLIAEARSAQVAVDRDRAASTADLASRFNRNPGSFMRLLRLNYLAPDIIAAIHDGSQPTGLKRKDLLNADLPLDWALQRQLFGFPEQPPMQTSERY